MCGGNGRLFESVMGHDTGAQSLSLFPNEVNEMIAHSCAIRTADTTGNSGSMTTVGLWVEMRLLSQKRKALTDWYLAPATVTYGDTRLSDTKLERSMHLYSVPPPRVELLATHDAGGIFKRAMKEKLRRI